MNSRDWNRMYGYLVLLGVLVLCMTVLQITNLGA